MSPELPSSETRELARQLLAATSSNSQLDAASRVIEQLGVALTRFAGAESFLSLLRRSLLLASTEVPALANVKVGADGKLRGLDDAVVSASGNAAGAEDAAAIAITSHLLWLLVTFIGTSLTIKVVRDAWPDPSLETHQSRTEDEA